MRGYDLGRTRQRSAGLPGASPGRASPGSLAAGFQYRQQQRPSTAGNEHNGSDGRSVSASRLAAVPLRVDVVQAQTKGMQQSAARKSRLWLQGSLLWHGRSADSCTHSHSITFRITSTSHTSISIACHLARAIAFGPPLQPAWH